MNFSVRSDLHEPFHQLYLQQRQRVMVPMATGARPVIQSQQEAESKPKIYARQYCMQSLDFTRFLFTSTESERG